MLQLLQLNMIKTHIDVIELLVKSCIERIWSGHCVYVDVPTLVVYPFYRTHHTGCPGAKHFQQLRTEREMVDTISELLTDLELNKKYYILEGANTLKYAVRYHAMRWQYVLELAQRVNSLSIAQR